MNNEHVSKVDALFTAIHGISPALLRYTQEAIVDELWHRPGLSSRDRAIVTIATLISRNASSAYEHYIHKALDNEVTADELSELVTHLAFYACFAYAFGAVIPLKAAFEARGIAPSLTSATPKGTHQDVWPTFLAPHARQVSPALSHFTDTLVQEDLWQRPALSPRDRTLITLASLAAQGQTAALPVYLAHASTHGITRQEIGEMLGHTAFYGSWGNAMQAANAIHLCWNAA